MYPTDLVVTIEDDRVKFENGKNRLEIYADKTIWQEDSFDCGVYNPETGKIDPTEQTPTKERQVEAFTTQTCMCGKHYQAAKGCWCLGDGWNTLHIQADHVAFYTDEHCDVTIIFEMVEPLMVGRIKAKIGELLKLEPIEHLLSKDELEERLAKFNKRMAEGCISYTI